MAERYRATMHNGRTRAATGESFNVKHNDRNCRVAGTINPEPERKNRYFIYGLDGSVEQHPTKTFEQHEKEVYTALFTEMLEAQNERHRKAGHASRVRTMDDYRTSPKTCPEEIILQLGTKDDYADPAAFTKAVNLWCSRMSGTYGSNWRILDGAIHFDESTPHCHIRVVWTADGKDGLEVSQTKALAELCFERPDPTKPKDRHNNAKQSFTAVSREIWIAAAKQYGISIEEEPAEPGKQTLTKEEYLTEKIRAETIELRAERQELQEQVESLTEERTRLNAVVRVLRRLVAPFRALVDKLARLTCVDGKSALYHVREEVEAITKAPDIPESDLSDISNSLYYYSGNKLTGEVSFYRT